MIVPVTQAMTQRPLQEGGLERRLQGELQNLLSCIRDTAIMTRRLKLLRYGQMNSEHSSTKVMIELKLFLQDL